MSQILFRCLFFCSAVLSLNAALALSIADVLFVSKTYETKEHLSTDISNKQPKFSIQAIKLRNAQSTEFFTVDSGLTSATALKPIAFNLLFTSVINVLKLKQTIINISVEIIFRCNILSSLQQSLKTFSLTLLK